MKEKTDAELEAILPRVKGGIATLWGYSASLSELTLRITWPSTSENLHLICNGCTRIEASVAWGNVNLMFERTETEKIVLRDAGANFVLSCGLIRVRENVEPRY